ncbi:MAG: HNH endonuclease [Paludibacteraceae bacterium]|nr:HNH endonuclease [Paludibacteraceae bacterium]
MNSYQLSVISSQLTLHEVRAVPTKTGYLYYFDAYGHAYIWWQGMLKPVTPQSCKNKQTLKHNKGGGYLRLVSTSGSNYGAANRGRMLVHRGVAYAFPEICGSPDLFRNQIDHINGDRFDNRASNLRWVTASENMKAAYAKRKTN